MSKLKEFFNEVSGTNRIFTAEDIGEMSNNEFSQHEKAIDYQMGNLGIPHRSDLAGNSDVIYVQSYIRSDGTEVKAHYRSKPTGIVGGSISFPHQEGNSNSSDILNVNNVSLAQDGESVNILADTSSFLSNFRSMLGKLLHKSTQSPNETITGAAANGGFTEIFSDPQGYVNSVPQDAKSNIPRDFNVLKTKAEGRENNNYLKMMLENQQNENAHINKFA